MTEFFWVRYRENGTNVMVYSDQGSAYTERQDAGIFRVSLVYLIVRSFFQTVWTTDRLHRRNRQGNRYLIGHIIILRLSDIRRGETRPLASLKHSESDPQKLLRQGVKNYFSSNLFWFTVKPNYLTSDGKNRNREPKNALRPKEIDAGVVGESD